MASKTATSKTASLSIASTQTYVLLSLWDMGGQMLPVKKGELTERVKRIKYPGLFDELEATGAIAITKNKVSLSNKGVTLLGQGLTHAEFVFNAQVGARTANALLRWMRQMDGDRLVVNCEPTEQSSVQNINVTTYESFRSVALGIFDRLNQDFNLDNLVPIYRIRREMGDRVKRSQFDEWLLEMQTQDVWQLIGGEMPELTPDKAEDSIKTTLGGMRYYAKKL
jgi:hypothetical protein